MNGFERTPSGWTLTAQKPVLAHTDEKPFVTALQREKVYETDRGTVTVQVKETARIDLTTLTENGDTLTLSGQGHTLAVKVETLPDGVRLHFTGEEGMAYRFRLPHEESEAVFGGGEQYRQVNLRGEHVVNFVSEHIKAKTIIEKAILPRKRYREKSHADIGTYAPMPLFVTDAGRLILFDVDADGISELKDDWTFTFDACPRSLTILFGGSFRALSLRLAELIPNRMGVPDWCHDGMILGVQGGTETILRKAFAMLDAGAKVAGVWSQDWSGNNRTVMGYQVWWNWEVDDKLYSDLKGAIQKLNACGVKFLGYINPYLVKDGHLYNVCKDKGYLITKQDGSIYHIKSTTFDAGMLDLTNPEAVRYCKDVLIKQNMLDLGMSGWMADFGEYLPVDCVLHDGDPKKLHNVWPVLWAKLNREAIEEYGATDAMFFMRSGYLGVQSYAPIMWNGDQHTDLTHDYGMPCVMPASFNLGFSGVSFVHSDIGGFFTFGKLRRNAELFTRWMEMNAFTPMMRSHESLRPWANAQFDAPKVTPYTVKMTNVFQKLKPYRVAVLEDAKRGIPAIRPDFWEAGTFAARHDPYAFFFGDDLFVCPVIERKARHRHVTLPKGEWIHLWTGKAYAGETPFTIDAPLGQTPVFYRKGSAYTDLFASLQEH